MSRKYNTTHPFRARSRYGPKARYRDQYGTFRQGERLSNDKLNATLPPAEREDEGEN